MPDAREEVLREFTIHEATIYEPDEGIEADCIAVDHFRMADEILSLRAARDAAEREREHLRDQLRLCEIDCANQEARANDAEVQRDAAQAINERLVAAAKDLMRMGRHDGPCKFEEDGGACALHLEAVKARTLNMQAALDAALPAAEGEG